MVERRVIDHSRKAASKLVVSPAVRPPALVCLAIAGLALWLRLSLIDFPTNVHQDEPIVARLALRNAAEGRWRDVSVSWDSLRDWKWARPTYQFSPYTLLASAAVKLATAVRGPLALDDAIRLIRGLSALFGAAAGIFVFRLAAGLGASPMAAALAQGLLALSPLAVQDSIYARVDALAGLLVAAGLWWSLVALREGRRAPLAAAGGLAGLALAAKYNAFVPLLAALLAGLAWRRGDRAAVRLRRVGLVLVSAAAGFLLGTPELLRDSAPFFEGLGYEWSHYASGHIPHEAFSAADANWVYWPTYFFWIGLGGAALLGALVALAGVGEDDLRADVWWRGLLLVAVAGAALPRVRFERNWEPALGLLCVAAALGWARLAGAIVPRLVRGGATRRAVVAAAFALPVLQPAVVTARFATALRPDSSPWLALKRGEALDVVGMAFAFNRPEVNWPGRAFDVAVVDFGDPFSADGRPRWAAYAEACPSRVYESSWARFAYPFSTIDVYHGPRRLLFFPACPIAGEPWRPQPPQP